MKKSSSRNIFQIKFQVVCTIDPLIDCFAEPEIVEIRRAARGSIRNHNCEVETIEVDARWIMVVLDADPAVNLPKAISSLKAVLARRINKIRGARSMFWSPGYAVFSNGGPISPVDVSAQLDVRARNEPPRTGVGSTE